MTKQLYIIRKYSTKIIKKKSSSIIIIIFNLLLNILHDKKLVQTLQRPRCDSSITKFFTWQHARCKNLGRRCQICINIRTLSNDRHPAGRHSVFDGMMEVFGDWISKISQIDRWKLKLRSCCDQCLSDSLATDSPLKISKKNIRLFNRNCLRVTREH